MAPDNPEFDWLVRLESLKFPGKVNRRLHELMARHNEGLLEDAARRELELLVAVSEELSLIRMHAAELKRLQNREKSE